MCGVCNVHVKCIPMSWTMRSKYVGRGHGESMALRIEAGESLASFFLVLLIELNN